MTELSWIFLVILLILMPVSWLKPSARQKKLIDLRERARQLNIQVSVLPLNLNPQVKLHGAAYRWLRAADAVPLPGFWRWIRTEVATQEGLTDTTPWAAGWLLLEGDPQGLSAEQSNYLCHWLPQLEEDIFAIEWGSATFALWWHERGQAEQINVWDQQVKKLIDLPIRPLPSPAAKVRLHRTYI